MIRRIIHTIMLMGIVLFAVSCGSSGGGDGTAPVVTTDEVTISTTLDMLGTKSARAATNVTVTLMLADGTSVQMEDDGNGVYTCTVDYTDGDPVYIYADVDNITLKNFFDSIDVTGSAADLGATTPLTTMFVDVLEAMAAELGTIISSPAELLSAVKDATLEIDVETVKAETTEAGNPVYATLQNTYQAQLTWDNTVGIGVNDAVASSVTTVVQAGGISIPIAGSESDAAAEAVVTIATQIFSGNIDAFAAVAYAADYVDDGMTAEESILDMEDMYDLPAGYTTNIVSLTAQAVAMTADDPAYALAADGHVYRVLINSHFQMKDQNGAVVYEEANNDAKCNDAGLVVKKIGETWYALGDQQKVDYYNELGYDYGQDGNFMYLQVCQTDNYPVASVTATSSAFTGPVTLTQKDYEPECLQYQLWDSSQDAAWTQNSNRFCGATVTFHVTYADNTTETKTSTMPACENKTVTASAVKNSDGSVTLTYSLPANGEPSEINLNVYNFTNEVMFGADNRPFSATTYTFPAENFTAGIEYYFRVMFNDVYHRQYAANATLTY